MEERTWLFTLGNNWSSASRLRIKEEWDFVAECRRKGVPQTQYCKNGFVDTSTRLLDKIERNSVARQSARVKDRGKRSDPFVFELSGTQWTVSRVSVCLSVCRKWALRVVLWLRFSLSFGLMTALVSRGISSRRERTLPLL